jgi:hypothetical protein
MLINTVVYFPPTCFGGKPPSSGSQQNEPHENASNKVLSWWVYPAVVGGVFRSVA